MKSIPVFQVLVLCLMSLVSPLLLGSGFALYEGSARGNVLGGLTGHGDDAAAVFFNPAGITNLEGKHFMGGVTVISPFADLTTTSIYGGPTTEASYEDNLFTPPHIYYTKQYSEKIWFGFGLFSRFGLGSEFKKGWAGRYSNVNTTIETLTLNANVAYKVNDKVSLAFGLDAIWIDVRLEQDIDASRFLTEPHNNPDTTAYDATQVIEGDNVGYGFNAAGFFRPNDRWSFGLSYNSKVKQEIDDGVARYQKPQAPVPFNWFVDTNVAAEPIDLPEMLFLGGAYRVSDRLGIGGGAVFTAWSALDELVFNYETPFLVVPGLGVAVDRASRELRWKDVWRYNLGFEYRLNDRWELMWGFTYDESPLNDQTISYLLPANDRTLYNLGFSRQFDKWLLECSFNYLQIKDRTIDNRQLEEGVLAGDVTNGGAYLLGFSMSRRL